MHWLDSATLAKRAAAEAAALAPLGAGWSGRLAVQVGVPAVAFASAEKFGRCLLMDREAAPGVVRAAPEALPLPADSVDVLFLVHVLEGTESPSAVLAEAARVLRGEGRLVVLGFRPLSGAAVRRTPARMLRPHARTLGLFRLRLLAGRVGFVWERALALGCGPLERRLPGPWRQVWTTSYAAIARKRIAGMTVLRPSWPRNARKRRHAVLSGHGRAG